MNFYPFHIGDYLSHTAHLSDAEDLAYRRMLDLYYQTELPFNERDKAMIARKTRSTIETVEQILAEFFQFSIDDGMWHHIRCDVEIAKYHAKADSARKANQVRWGSEKGVKSDLKSDAPQILTKNQEPITKNQEPSLNTNVAPSAPVASPEIELVFEFWKTAMKSPRSMLDDKRRKAIKSALKTGYTAEQLCDAISGCAKSDFHMGKNDKGLKYNGLDLILRNAEYIDKFIVIGNSPLVPKRQGYTHDLSQMDYTKGVDEDGRF